MFDRENDNFLFICNDNHLDDTFMREMLEALVAKPTIIGMPSHKLGLLKVCEDDVEVVRRTVLGYAKTMLLNTGSERAFNVIEIFQKNFFDSGMPGLVACCYEATTLNG